jgi:hypothetical protein
MSNHLVNKVLLRPTCMSAISSGCAGLCGLAAQTGASGQPSVIGPPGMVPIGVCNNPVGNAGQPRSGPVSTVEQAGVVQVPVQHGGSVVRAAQLPGVAAAGRRSSGSPPSMARRGRWACRVGHAGGLVG